MKPTANSKLKRMVLSIVAMVLLIFVTFYLLLKDNSITVLYSALGKANPFYVGLGFILMIVFIVCEAGIIKMLMSSFEDRVSWRRAVVYSFIGFYFSSITPSSTGGQPAQIYYMSKDNIDVGRSSFALLIITYFYQLVMLLYGVLMYIINYSFINSHMQYVKWLLVLGVVANGASCIFILLVIFKKNLVEKIVYTVFSILCRLHIIRDVNKTKAKLICSIDEYSKGGEYLKMNPFLSFKILIATFVQITAIYCVPFCAYLALGLRGRGIMEFIAVQAILSLAVSAVPLPGAVGASEGGFMVLYSILFPQNILLSAMVLSRGISFYIFLLISSVGVLATQLRQNKSEYLSLKKLKKLGRCP